MKLSQRLSDHFDYKTREQGEYCHYQGKVWIEEGSPSHMLAHVRGAGHHDVDLYWEGGVLSVWCDCPEFIDTGKPCKHLWAGILLADHNNYLSAAANAPRLVFDCGGSIISAGQDDEDVAGEFQAVPSIRTPAPPKKPAWEEQLSAIVTASTQPSPEAHKGELFYLIYFRHITEAGLVVLVRRRERKLKGDWKVHRTLSLTHADIAQLPRSEDREILDALSGNQRAQGYMYGYGYAYADLNLYSLVPESYVLSPTLAAMLVPLLARTGRCYLQKENHQSDDLVPLIWDDQGAWQFQLDIRRGEDGRWIVAGFFLRGEERMQVAAPALVTQSLVFAQNRAAPLANPDGFDWIAALRKDGPIAVPAKDEDRLLSSLLLSPNLPPLGVPEELRYEELAIAPRPYLKISKISTYQKDILRAELAFAYDRQMIRASDPARGFFDPTTRRFTPRQMETERSAEALLQQLGSKLRWSSYRERYWEVPPGKLPGIVRALVEVGWHIEAEGKVFRRPGAFHLEVSSGIDWFELHGGVEYENTQAPLPQLLEALRRGDNLVELGDGTYGVLPEEWLRRMGTLVAIGTPENGHIRFRTAQAGILDALLSTLPEARCDETFARVRAELGSFRGVERADQPPGFVGQLRGYQCEGLGWMHFLRRFSFGGCLADDMGVGKTAQVLALLETRRALRATGEAIPPSLVVAPRSLIFNWKQEAARFTPQLRVRDHSGLDRNGKDFSGYDLVLTTYGTLRRDIVTLKDMEFDYVVLDEAQAVKNAATESSKAVRLVRGRHRLALSGTPVENHLGELWTLFEFLNPGMLGAASAFKVAGGAMRNPDEETRRLLAHALRPFILRRTKEQVASELPAKTEQTVYCEMDAPQRKLYDELRNHYRASLLKRIADEGLAKSKIHVLEALLRLRQVACHPGLLDRGRSGESSAKLESLLEHLTEVLDEGHKALVFSQFTSLLRIVRQRLDRRGITYEYLDGATRDRQARVERFQNEKDCPLFLISLKAGGLGLNLTAAEYVFILDPWWNPAVEAQAVDRAHRIGQTRHVFAYRLITRDTVEEKVLELQKSKRDLASAIISADNSMIRDLEAEDLALLLS